MNLSHNGTNIVADPVNMNLWELIYLIETCDRIE